MAKKSMYHPVYNDYVKIYVSLYSLHGSMFAISGRGLSQTRIYTMKPTTIADFVEVNAHALFEFNDEGKPVIDPTKELVIRERLYLIFSTEHTLVAKSTLRGLIIPGGLHQLTNRSNAHAPSWLVIEDADSKQGFGDYCIPLGDFINAFSDSTLPTHD
jgi:hypothetical protein